MPAVSIMEAVGRVSALAGRAVEVSVLSGGFTNGVFLVKAGDERYVFRVPGDSSDLLEINRANERHNAAMAATTGVSPEVLDYVEGLNVMVLPYIEGVVPEVGDLQTPRQVERIAASVRSLHAGPRFTNDADVFGRAKRWLRACGELSIPVPDGIHERMPVLSTLARSLDESPQPSAPCHNDLAPYNFIDDGNQLWIIDFEFSGNNDPCFDLGGIASEAELDDDLRAVLCQSYFGESTPALLARMELCAVLASVGWSLYCAIQAVVLGDDEYWEGSTSYWKAVVDALDSDELPSLLRSVTRG